MAERESIRLWSTTALTNNTVDPGTTWPEGMVPGQVNDSARGIMAAVARDKKDTNGTLTSGGSSNAYTLTVNATWTAYATGQEVSFKASFSNTGASTLNVTNADATALGAKAIRCFTPSGDSPLVAGMIVTNGHYRFRYDAAANSAAGAWILLNATNPIVSASSPLSISAAGALTLGTVAVANGGTGDTGTAWTSYSPSISAGTGTFTTTSATGLYKQIGKSVFIHIKITITNVGTAAGSVIASLPVTVTAVDQLLPGMEYNVTGKAISGYVAASGSSVSGKFYDNTFSPANNHIYLFQGVLESS